MNKRESIFKTAAHLFAAQGYEATTTMQIARKVGVTEPAVFDFYNGKEVLFIAVFKTALSSYLSRIKSLDPTGRSAFECLEVLIRHHFSIVAEQPELMRIYLRTCPARLDYPESTCSKLYRQSRSTLKKTAINILKKGSASGEFIKVDTQASANMLMALMNGLMHQQIEGMDKLKKVEAAAVAFCRKALVVGA